MASTVTPPSTFNLGRIYLLVSCVFAVVGGSSLLWRPSFMLELPLLAPIERLTGLPHVNPPTTPEEQRLVSLVGASIIAIGLLQGVPGGPQWRYGGNAYVQMSIDARLIFALTTTLICFFTSHGSSFLFLVGVFDAIFASSSQWILGGRGALYGVPNNKRHA